MKRATVYFMLGSLAFILSACGGRESKGDAFKEATPTPAASSGSAANEASGAGSQAQEPKAAPSAARAEGATTLAAAPPPEPSSTGPAKKEKDGKGAAGGEERTEATVVKPAEKPSSDPAVAAIDEFIKSKNIDVSAPGWKLTLPKPPKVSFDNAKKYYWNLATSKGSIKIRLMPDVAPMHVSSTIYLTRLGFYDGLLFHRVIDRFMAQGGCPKGDGTSDPGYEYAGEFSPAVRHDRPGLLSMANAGPSTDGSQFFLTFVPTPHLDGRHTIFGEVVDGMETVKRLEAAGSGTGAPKEKLVMEKSTITVE